ncbi:hypothetical protein [Verrucomicrobium spinosum]|uniref:hypothetical protein n=1 Tax=Verrucomicrobium spinosum TaxID=2736 RepID=UPI00210F1E5B|nr:hypothetical protein [Verrucomicrobium spinosum]
MPHANRRPSLEILNPRNQLVQTEELQVLDGVFIGSHLIALQVKEVHHAEVDLADLIRVVIDQADDLLSMTTREHQFFFDLALDAVEVGRLGQGVLPFIVRLM